MRDRWTSRKKRITLFMSFFSKRKQLRDIEMGLVFRWRSSRRHHTGKILAFALTTAFFLLSIYAVRVEGVHTPLLTKQTGEIILLLDNVPECRMLLLKVEDRSPFPNRWDPASDKNTMKRVDIALRKLEEPIWDYQPTMMALPEVTKKEKPPLICQDNHCLFQALQNDWERQSDDKPFSPITKLEEVSVVIQFIATSPLRERLPSLTMQIDNDQFGEDWYGQSFRFLIGIDPTGVVRGCLPLSGSTIAVVKPTTKQQILSDLLRKTRFKPTQKNDQITNGVLELTIKASEE